MTGNRFSLLYAALVILPLTSVDAWADNAPFAFDLPKQVENPEVIGPNTTAADPARWPSTYVFHNADGAGCTATAIGRQVVITAAHCIADGAVGTVQIKQTAVKVTCMHHPGYPADISADFSLCFTNTAIETPTGGFERINTDPTLTTIGKSIILLGYGCRKPGGGDQTFGYLFEGQATVKSVERSDYIVTGGGTAVCFGDSGGGAYAELGTDGTQRRLVAINSRGDISQFSWLSVTASPLFRNWAAAWLALPNHVQASICGLNAPAQICRA